MHDEYISMVPGADTAVLFIHGICGTPDHFRELIPLQERVPENISVYNLLLDGHGGSVADFAATSGKKWREQVFSAFEMLASTHEQIYLVGHSMGTLFALQLAAEHPQNVKKLFLLAVPMRPWLKPALIADLLLMVFGRLENAPPHRIALSRAAGIRTTWKLWEYIPWIPRFLDLFREISRTEGIISDVMAEALCWQSQKDELVLRRSEKILERNRNFRIMKLKNSSHFYYAPDDREQILGNFESWIHDKTHD